MDLTSYHNSILSLLSPFLAILFAIITRKVFLSLMIGIITGSFLLNQFQIIPTIQLIVNNFLAIFWDNNEPNTSKLFIIIFMIILGIITSLISISGGAQSFGNWAKKKIKTKKGSQLFTVFLGFIIFIDDYFNSLAVGSISRPLTDQHSVSRSKLAYLIDSTAAPVCVLTPISSWGAYIIALIGTILANHGITNITPIMAFFYMIPMNFYALFALLLVICVAWFDINVFTMKKHEKLAQNGTLYDLEKGEPAGSSENLKNWTKKGNIFNLIIPISSLIISAIISMIYTGNQQLKEHYQNFSILGAFENTDVITSLLYSGIISLIITILLSYKARLKKSAWKIAFIEGTKSMLPAINILILAWVLVDIINILETGKYLASIVENSNIDAKYLPIIFFIISSIMAFSTGTSWGTFGIMLPIAGDLAHATELTMMLPMLASVLSGSVFGDHCSPISDTTILSSTGASCHHIDHVITQLPYALFIAIIASIGYYVLGITGSIFIGFITTLTLFSCSVLIIKK